MGKGGLGDWWGLAAAAEWFGVAVVRGTAASESATPVPAAVDLREQAFGAQPVPHPVQMLLP